MLTLFISFIISLLLAWSYSFLPGASWGAGVLFVFVCILSYFLISRIAQKGFLKIFNSIQKNIQVRNQSLESKVKRMRVGSEKVIASEQKKIISDALLMLKGVEKYYKWNFLLKKQVATLKFQFNFQIQNFKEVKKYLSNILLFEFSIIAMKMVVLYKVYAEKEGIFNEIFKTLKKSSWRVRDKTKKGFIYNVFIWITQKMKKNDEVIKYLAKIEPKLKNEKFTNNFNRLKNNLSINNNSYGNLWWMLHLEKPKATKIKRVTQKGGKRYA